MQSDRAAPLIRCLKLARHAPLVLLLAACDGGGGTPPPTVVPPSTRDANVRVPVQLEDSATGAQLGVRAWYRRSTGERIALTETAAVPASSGSLTLSLTFPVTACVSDALRAPATAGCPVGLDIVLYGPSGPAADSVSIGAVSVAPGDTVTARTISALRLVRTLQLRNPTAPDSAPTIPVGAIIALDASARDRANSLLSSRRFTWRVAPDSIGTVSATGVLEVRGVGTATVTVLADEDTTKRATIQFVTSGGGIYRSISRGTTVSCALDVDQRPYCWGKNPGGRLGVRDDGRDVLAPREVLGGHTFIQISAGGSHVCGITPDHDALCWGDNASGALGDGTTVTKTRPTPVAGGRKFRSIATGAASTCAVTATVPPAAFCWGRNDAGQLGDSTRIDKNVPTAVVGPSGIEFVAVGAASACGNVTGVLYCWGSNAFGELGNGSYENSSVPIRVVNLPYANLFTVGGASACATDGDSRALCWGSNSSGLLGNGSNVARTSVPVRVAGDRVYTALHASLASQVVCGTERGVRVVHCWGSNADGSLGTGTTQDANTPVPVAGGRTFSSSLGEGAPCAFTLKREAYCWGRNGGTLGDNSTVNRRTPVWISSPTP